MSEFKMMVCNQGEEDFFLSHLTKDMRVLEYGSGASTLAIAPLVKEIVSIEHDANWYNQIREKLPINAKLYFAKPNNPDYQDDGTLEDFKNYVLFPADHDLGKFDLIFIDGRARVACASVCREMAHENTLVFIHDFNHPEEKWRRQEYYAAEQYLQRLEGVFTMWKFKIKE